MPGPVSTHAHRHEAGVRGVAAGHRDRAAAGVCRRAFATRFVEDLADPHRIDVDERQVVGRGVGERDAGGGSRGPERAHDLGDDQVHGRRFAVEGEGPGLGQSQGAEVVDEPGHHLGLVEDRREVGLVGRDRRHQDGLEVAGDDGQWRPEFVADVGEEGPSLGLVGFEAGGHRVEARDELANGPHAVVRADPDRCSRRLPRDGWPRPVHRGWCPCRGARWRSPIRMPTTTRAAMTPDRPELREDEGAGGDERARDGEEDEPEEAAEGTTRAATHRTASAAGSPGAARAPRDHARSRGATAVGPSRPARAARPIRRDRRGSLASRRPSGVVPVVGEL